jgi:hypothetical protein
MKDLLVLVADKNMQFALKGALERPPALGICSIEYELLVHAQRDGGVRKTGPEILRLQRRRFKHGLLMLDFEGSGTRSNLATELEAELNQRLYTAWGDSAKAIVIAPELEVWLWGSYNLIAEIIHWQGELPLEQWLANQGFLFERHKPNRPKEALERLLIDAKQPRSAALYKKITDRISLKNCTDAAYLRLRQYLISWFGL